MPTITTQAGLLDYLDAAGIEYQCIEHPPVFTCEQAAQYRPPVAGLDTKNLFLRDEKGGLYLLVTDCEKRLNLKQLSRALGAPKLHFASPELLLDVLGLTPGSVTLLGLVNDGGRRVALVVDGAYWPAETYLCHPMVNTATLLISHAALWRFLALTGHIPRVVEMAIG